MSGLAAAAAAGTLRILDKNVFSVLRTLKGPCRVINRRMCSKTQADSVLKSKPQTPGSTFKIPGYKPTEWDKKILVWTGRFKKAEDIPGTILFEVVNTARNKLRVRISYLMIALTICGCLIMVIAGKRAAARHESLVNQNMEKKALQRAEAVQSTSAKP
ncbi:protein FAM162A [Rhineura floridana]|uniref:protein FAM162A n=1 Tax=Rhineura floridana TaxID=261503 RepID=UPI002AC8034B|nr:protein FAM162A [Rhineura floridana]